MIQYLTMGHAEIEGEGNSEKQGMVSADRGIAIEGRVFPKDSTFIIDAHIF